MRKMSTIQKVNWYKNLNNCGHTENLGALFLTKVVTKFHNNTESILLRYLWARLKKRDFATSQKEGIAVNTRKREKQNIIENVLKCRILNLKYWLHIILN